MKLTPLKLVSIVRAVREATKRIPKPQRSGVTYFSMWDTWLFQSVFDARRCDVCDAHEVVDVYYGDQLRRWFPYLEILDENTIQANVHPNCRCYLVRKID